MSREEWMEKTGIALYGIVIFLSVPIFALAVVVTSWIAGLSASDRHAVQHALGGNKNLIVAGACGMSGSVIWIIGTVVIVARNEPGFFMLLLSEILWIITMAESPWHAGSTLSNLFESIHSSKTASRTVTALLALVTTNVICFLLMILSVMIEESSKANKAGTRNHVVVASASAGVAAASMPRLAASTSHPTDLERNSPSSHATSPLAAQAGSPSAVDTEKPEIQDGAG